MKTEDIKKMALAVKSVRDKQDQLDENKKADLAKKLAKASASSEKGKAAVTLPKAPFDIPKKEGVSSKMDPVDSKELKGKHKDRKDKDIDNDGDVDSSDEYLHKRRKAITKATKGSEVETYSESTEVELDEVSNSVKDQLGNIDLSIRDWERRWKNKSAGNPNDMKAPQKIKDLKAQKAALMKKHGIKEEKGELDEAGRPKPPARRFGRKGAPKMTGDSIKIQRAKDAEHNAAMGRTKTGRKKPERTMTSTQRSLASLRNEDTQEQSWSVYSRILEKREGGRGEHYKGATKPDSLKDDDTLPGKGAKEMDKDIQVTTDKHSDFDTKGHDDASKAARTGPSAKADPHTRGANKGDKAIVNPVKGAPKA